MTRLWSFTVLGTFALTAIFLPVAANAGMVTEAGRATYVPVSSKPTKLPDGRTVLSNHNKGVLIADDKNSVFHHTQQDCFATVVVAKDGKSGEAMGQCSNIDKNGNVTVISFKGDFNGGTWQFIGGTGDMAKISGGGTYKAIAQMPNGNTVSWWEGKWSTD
jgi:hypothetical protein